MRALVAESNAVTRASLRRILERTGFEVEELRDELAAACLIHEPGAPELALLAVDTLLADFGQVCAAMRQVKPEVYIVALVPQARRIDVGTVLDSGADDFLLKPATLQETEARIRVIRSVLTARKTKSRGEAEAGGGLRDAATAASTEGRIKETATSEGPRILRTLRVLLNDLTSTEALADVFDHTGLAPIEEVPPDDAGEKGVYSVWAPLLVIIQHSAQWLNTRIDLDRKNALQLFGAVERYDSFSEERLLRVLHDIMELVQDGIRTRAENAGGADLHIPIHPIARQSDAVPHPTLLAGPNAERKLIGLRLKDDLRLLMTVTMEPIPKEEPSIASVQPLDVLARDVHSAEYQIMLLRAGTMLNDDYIRKIRAFIHSNNLSQKLEVFRPPSGTAAFLTEAAADAGA